MNRKIKATMMSPFDKVKFVRLVFVFKLNPVTVSLCKNKIPQYDLNF